MIKDTRALAAFLFLVLTLVSTSAKSQQAEASDTLQTELWAAVHKGDLQTVEKILGKDGFIPQLKGTDCGHHEICNLISYAAENQKSVEIVKRLVEAGAEIDENDGGTGDTPIQRALLASNLEIAEYLAAQGAVPLKENRFGVPAFIFAAGLGSPKLLNLMIENGAPVDLQWRMPDLVSGKKGVYVEGMTPLMIASFHGRLDLIEELLKSGADPLIRDYKGRNFIGYIKAGKKSDIQTEAITLANKYCKCELKPDE